jgi:hypothetical protein
MATTAPTIDLTERRLRRDLPVGRTLHLIDIENLVGGSHQPQPAEAVRAALASYGLAVPFGRYDHGVLACGRALGFATKDAWPGALVKVGHGIDGADRLLLAEADPAYCQAHYSRVVVASGDRCFRSLVVELDQAGVDVCVVSRRKALSRQLELVAPVVWYLDDLRVAVA